jgi:hypothetical protein
MAKPKANPNRLSTTVAQRGRFTAVVYRVIPGDGLGVCLARGWLLLLPSIPSTAEVVWLCCCCLFPHIVGRFPPSRPGNQHQTFFSFLGAEMQTSRTGTVHTVPPGLPFVELSAERD